MKSPRPSVPIAIGLLALTASACGGKSLPEAAADRQDTKTPKAVTNQTQPPRREEVCDVIEPGEVRVALLRLIAEQKKSEFPVIKREVDVRRNSPISDKEGSTYRIGDWLIVPEKQTFAVRFTGLPFLLQYTGRFERNEGGTWKAVIAQRFQGPVEPSKRHD